MAKIWNCYIGHWLRLVLVCLICILSFSLLMATPVFAAVQIAPAVLPTGQVGSSYYAVLTATGGTPPYTWSAVSALPSGLSLSSSGAISGTPTVAGTFNFTAQVTDAVPDSDTQAFVIVINERPLIFSTADLPNATEGKTYSGVVRVTGGTSPYTYSLVGGSLPSGLTLRSTGIISGTPDQGTAGTYSFTVTATDSSSPTALTGQQSYYIIIEKGGFQVTVTIGSGLKAGETPVYLGNSNNPVATLQGGDSVKLDFDLGVTQTVRVEPIVEHPSEAGVRFKAEVDKITVNEYSTDATFPYHTEYEIEIKAEPSNIAQLTGSGWYQEGYTLRTTAPSDVLDQNNAGTQYRFSSWKLPTGESLSSRDLTFITNAPGSCVANYDTYYRLTLASPYGEAEGSDWYKAGSTAEWSVKSPEARMSGILGLFGGKLGAINASGTTLMDGPKTVNIDWAPDYTMPFIFIPLTLVLIVLGIYGIYRLLHGPKPRPAPFPPPYQPMPPPMPPPPPQTTVVMLGGDKPRLGPPTTREQLMEKFGELLEKYEEEIKTKVPGQELPPGVQSIKESKGLPAAELPASTFVESGTAAEEESTACDYTSKRPLRVVSTDWRRVASKDAPSPSTEGGVEDDVTGPVVVWARDIYQEWEILTCWLPRGHQEQHDGPAQIVYSLINTVTEVKMYKPEQELAPPKPHYTDDMPQVDVAAREVVSPDKLPKETSS